MHKPESVPENESHKIFKAFEIQMDHLIPVRSPDQVLSNSKEISHLFNVGVQADHKVIKKERENIDMCVTVIPVVVISKLGAVAKEQAKEIRGIGNQRKNDDHADHSISKID